MRRLAEVENELDGRITTLSRNVDDVRSSIDDVDRRVTVLSTAVQEVSELARGEIKKLNGLKKWALGTVVSVLLTGSGVIANSLITEGGRRVMLAQQQQDLVDIKDAKELQGRKLDQVATALATLDAALREWRAAQERRLQQLEQQEQPQPRRHR